MERVIDLAALDPLGISIERWLTRALREETRGLTDMGERRRD